MSIVSIPIETISARLGFEEPFALPVHLINKSLDQWQPEFDDESAFRYIYRNFKPKRHLEFGTWQGKGAVFCLQESEATVWTINRSGLRPQAETCPGFGLELHEIESAKHWARVVGLAQRPRYRSDKLGFIGRHYLSKDLGHRVCQIYCDSRNWDINQYPKGFFDSALIDGGHEPDVISNDTEKAFDLVRHGGLLLWHDFCPPIANQFQHTRSVTHFLLSQSDDLHSKTSTLFWLDPSWILVGIKR